MEQTRDVADGYVPYNIKLADYGLDMPGQVENTEVNSNNMPNIYNSSEYHINTMMQSPIRPDPHQKAESHRNNILSKQIDTDRDYLNGKDFGGIKTMSNENLGGKKKIISHEDQIKHRKKEVGTGIQEGGDYGLDQLHPGYYNLDQNKVSQDNFNDMNLNLKGHQNKSVETNEISNRERRNNFTPEVGHPTQQSQEFISTMKDQTQRDTLNVDLIEKAEKGSEMG